MTWKDFVIEEGECYCGGRGKCDSCQESYLELADVLRKERMERD